MLRREILLASCGWPVAILTLGTNDNTTIVNSVLSAYGLPTFRTSGGFTLFDEFQNDYSFEYPSSWVMRRNSQRQGVYVSDFQTADKATVEIFPVPSDGNIVNAALAEAIAPGRSQQNDRLLMPSKRRVKTTELKIDGQKYMYITFPSDTITRSGYQVERQNIAVVACKKDVAYLLNTSATSDQFSKEKQMQLQHIVDSFRIR